MQFIYFYMVDLYNVHKIFYIKFMGDNFISYFELSHWTYKVVINKIWKKYINWIKRNLFNKIYEGHQI